MLVRAGLDAAVQAVLHVAAKVPGYLSIISSDFLSKDTHVST